MEEKLGRCTVDHTEEQVTLPPGEEGPKEVVHAVQSASSETPQPCHEQPCPTPLELNKSHLRPLYPLGKENDGETLEDKACQNKVSESALFESKHGCGTWVQQRV